MEHKINTTNLYLYLYLYLYITYIKQYRFSPAHKNKQIGNMLEQNIIAESEFLYNSPLWIVPKKVDLKENKRWRLVIQFPRIKRKDTWRRVSVIQYNRHFRLTRKREIFQCIQFNIRVSSNSDVHGRCAKDNFFTP